MNRISINFGCALTIASASANLFATDFTWSAGGGLWSDQGFWSPVAPIGGPGVNDNVFVTNALLIETITITATAGANVITLSDGGFVPIADAIILNNGVDFVFGGGGFLNDGRFMQNSAGADTFVQFLGDQTVAGRGEWVMSDDANNRIILNGAQLKHGNGFGHEIRGAGQLLANTGSLWNLATIRQQGSNALVIDPNGNGVYNDGLLIVEGAGGLNLTSGSFDNADGAIQAADASLVRIDNATVIGCTLETGGSGEVLVNGSTFTGVTNNGLTRQTNGNDSSITGGGVTNNDTWTQASSGADTFMQFLGNQTLGGSGEVVLSDHVNNRISSNGGVLTIGAQQTVRGAGQLGANTAGFINEGSIIAEGENAAMTIDPNGTGFENRGLLEARGVGGLRHVGNLVQTAGTTRVDSTLSMIGGELDLRGGLLAGTGVVIGKVDNSGGVVNAGNSPGTLQIDGDYDQGASGTLLIEIAGTAPGLFDILLVNGTAALGGTVDVELLGAPAFAAGQSFDVLIADLIVGTFLNNQVLAGGVLFDVSVIGEVQDIVRLTAR